MSSFNSWKKKVVTEKSPNPQTVNLNISFDIALPDCSVSYDAALSASRKYFNDTNLSEDENKIFTNDLNRDAIIALSSAVLQMQERLPLYQTMIVDDVSARIPGFILRKVIKDRKRKKGINDNLSVFYRAFGRDISEEKIIAIERSLKQEIEKNNGTLGKVLFVTEHIHTSGSAIIVAKVLKKLGIDYDFMTVSQFLDKDHIDRISNNTGAEKYVIGEYASLSGAAHYKEKYNGVVKNPIDSSPYSELITPKAERKIFEELKEKKYNKDDLTLDDRVDLSKLIKLNEKVKNVRDDASKAAKMIIDLLDKVNSGEL